MNAYTQALDLLGLQCTHVPPEHFSHPVPFAFPVKYLVVVWHGAILPAS